MNALAKSDTVGTVICRQSVGFEPKKQEPFTSQGLSLVFPTTKSTSKKQKNTSKPLV